jgi:hypothetical protein
MMAGLFDDPSNRKRLLLIVLTSFFSQHSENGLVSYYLHDILNSVDDTNSKDQSLQRRSADLVMVGLCLLFSRLC